MTLDALFVYATQQMLFAVPWGKELAIFCARWLIVVFVLLGLWFFRKAATRDRHLVYDAIGGVGLAFVARFFLSVLLNRPRPFLAHPDIVLLVSPPLHTSFPSGHAAVAFAIASALFCINRRIGLIVVLIATLVAFGRIAVGVHYPTDVLGGALLGIGSFIVVRRVFHTLRKKV